MTLFPEPEVPSVTTDDDAPGIRRVSLVRLSALIAQAASAVGRVAVGDEHDRPSADRRLRHQRVGRVSDQRAAGAERGEPRVAGADDLADRRERRIDLRPVGSARRGPQRWVAPQGRGDAFGMACRFTDSIFIGTRDDRTSNSTQVLDLNTAS